MAYLASFEKDEMWIVPMTEKEIEELPRPGAARLVGGVAVFETWDVLQVYKIEKLRKMFQNCIVNMPVKDYRMPIVGTVKKK